MPLPLRLGVVYDVGRRPGSGFGTQHRCPEIVCPDAWLDARGLDPADASLARFAREVAPRREEE